MVFAIFEKNDDFSKHQTIIEIENDSLEQIIWKLTYIG